MVLSFMNSRQFSQQSWVVPWILYNILYFFNLTGCCGFLQSLYSDGTLKSQFTFVHFLLQVQDAGWSLLCRRKVIYWASHRNNRRYDQVGSLSTSNESARNEETNASRWQPHSTSDCRCDLSGSRENEEGTSFLDLPNEVIAEIFKYLDVRTRLRMRINRRLDKIELGVKNAVNCDIRLGVDIRIPLLKNNWFTQ